MGGAKDIYDMQKRRGTKRWLSLRSPSSAFMLDMRQVSVLYSALTGLRSMAVLNFKGESSGTKYGDTTYDACALGIWYPKWHK